LRDYKIHSADVLVRDPEVTVEDFIDVINASHRAYIPCLYCYNKIDAVSLEETDRLARQPHSVVISVSMGLGINDLLERIWEDLSLLRIFTKRKGVAPNFNEPMVVRKAHNSIEDVCDSIHRDFKSKFRYALVWGASAKHSPQKCGLQHKVQDEDVVSIFTK
jgi:ribosome-interacting GTPase 1